MATVISYFANEVQVLRFQSIGVTKEWRHLRGLRTQRECLGRFPINRRHQRMATLFKDDTLGMLRSLVSNQ